MNRKQAKEARKAHLKAGEFIRTLARDLYVHKDLLPKEAIEQALEFMEALETYGRPAAPVPEPEVTP